jgi:hypothetical protein
MPRRHRHRNRTMKGGFLDNLSNTLSGWGTSISQGASSMWEKTKSTVTGTTPTTMTTPTLAAPTTYATTPMSTSTYGGKYSRRRRHLRGGFKDNTPTTGLAASAASISNIKNAEAKLVGGRTRRRGRKGGKTRRH